MRRGIGRLRAGGIGGFSPSSITFTTGLWLDPSDISTGFTDSAGTIPQTASGQQTGKRLDKSGNGNHVTQSTANSRPEYDVITGISSDFFDGTDDGYSNAATTFGSSMDCFIAIKRASTSQGIICSRAADAALFGAFQSSSANAATQGGGASSTYWVNGGQLTGGTAVTQGTVDAALPNGTWKVLEVRNLDLSTWTTFRVGLFTSYQLGADIGGIILCPAQSTTNRNSIRTWLGSKVGLAL